MNTLSRDDAARALNEIGEAGQKITTLRNYRHSAPFFLTWGLVWLVVNAINDFYPATTNEAWLAGTVIGSAVTLAIVVLQGRRRAANRLTAAVRTNSQGWRAGVMFLVIGLFFTAMFTVIGPIDGRQTNAFISLFWVFCYMGAGVMFGWRLFVIGAVAAAGIMFGYLNIHQHFDLWMGVFAGGALIAGGLWLRKA